MKSVYIYCTGTEINGLRSAISAIFGVVYYTSLQELNLASAKTDPTIRSAMLTAAYSQKAYFDDIPYILFCP